MNIYDYNAKKRFDRDNSLVYDEDGNFYWQWDSKENREKFKKIRIRSDKLRNRTTFLLSAVFLNHLVSGLNAALCAKSIKNENLSLDFSAENTLFPTYYVGLNYKF